MKPEVPPQVPSVETLPLAEAAGAELDRTTVELARTLAGAAELTLTVDGAAGFARTELVLTTGVDWTDELAAVVLPQPKAMLLSCQVSVVEEKPDQTKPWIALTLAPLNWERGTVMVWAAPVRPESEM